MFKNVATKIALFAFDTTTGAPKTGDAANLTAYVSKDYGSVTVLADTSATEMDATNAKGWYLFDVAQAESNADALLFTAKSATSNVSVVGQYVHTTPNRFTTLVIDAAGLADANAVKVGPTGAGTAQTAGDIPARLPAALGANGSIKADVRDYNGAAGTFSAGRPEVNTSHAAGTAWNSGAIGAATLATDTITAAKIAADAIGASELAADAVAEIQSGLATAANLATVAGYIDTEITDIQSRLPAALVSGRMDSSVGAIAANAITATSIATGAIDADALATDAAAEIALAIAGLDISAYDYPTFAGYLVNVDLGIISVSTGLGGLALQSSLTTVGGTVNSIYSRIGAPAGASVSADVAAAKADTAAVKLVTVKLDTMLETTANSPGDWEYSADALRKAPTGTGSGGGSAPSAADVADAVWDEVLSGHVGAGSAGAILAAVKAKTDNLPSDPADASDIAGAFATVNTKLDTIDDFLDTEVGAIKAKTDLIPASPAAVGDVPTANQNADAILARNISGGSSTGRTVTQALHGIRNRFGYPGGVYTVYETDDTTVSWTGAVTTDPAAAPVIGMDPA